MESKVRRRRSAAAIAVTPTDSESLAHAGQLGGTLIEFPHGLGDLVQLGIVLRHLQAANPGMLIDVVVDQSKVLSYTGYERTRLGFNSPRHRVGGWHQVIPLGFPDCTGDVGGFPATKPYRCIVDFFRLEPRLELFGYCQVIGEAARTRAARYLASIAGKAPTTDGRFPVVILHYQGISSRMHKDLAHEHAAEICSAIRLRGRAACVFDLERISPVVDQSTVHSPLNGHPVWAEPGIADPETMAAMIAQCELFIGIDSGPLHLAGATDTPSLGVWTHHHPTRFFDFAPNVLHLVPVGHKRFAPGPRSLQVFAERYRSHVYGNVVGAVVEELHKSLDGTLETPAPQSNALPGLKATSFGEEYYTEHVLAGLDYCGHGDWQRDYGAWVADVFDWRGKRVLDVGCACGSILRGLGHAGIVVQGFDLSEFMVTRGRRKWPDQAGLMHVCDAVNLHLWGPGEWQGLHSNQVAEHWRPDLVPFILKELARVTNQGGLFFCVLDTDELFGRNGRTLDTEDPTHVCVKPLAWWHEHLESSGWRVVSEDFRGPLSEHAGSFFKRYDWDWFVAARV